jgi:hypothetical protein
LDLSNPAAEAELKAAARVGQSTPPSHAVLQMAA